MRPFQSVYSPMSILLVEDDDLLVCGLREAFGQAGFDVDTCSPLSWPCR